MAGFIPHTEKEIKEMAGAIGVSSISELFKEIGSLAPKSFDIPGGMTEFEAMQALKSLAGKNRTYYVSFLGGGYYDHYIPAAVDALSMRSEFYTAYTPYQPEASQGTLQAIFEYQTMTARLTGLDYANASLYDGGTA
ncbi:MAG TPA: glycine dehydrogenase, partial [bacterium]|nr:glycine dehydrogenase [bacterium]